VAPSGSGKRDALKRILWVCGAVLYVGYVWAQQAQKTQAPLEDWPNLARYRTANEGLPSPNSTEQRVVFFGDSITDAWGRSEQTGVFFPGKPYENRGIGGQTTPQMLVRFQQDVIRLHPAAVVILAGTNDIAGNTGPTTNQMIEDNFTSMVDIAKQSGIKVVLASITPAYAYPWKPGIQPVERIRALNKWLQDFCAGNGCVYLDYYNSMADANGAMLPGLSSDGVHPTAKGYAVMAPLAEAAIAQALGH
jgi:lysophospholipase L1-like esterase